MAKGSVGSGHKHRRKVKKHWRKKVRRRLKARLRRLGKL